MQVHEGDGLQIILALLPTPYAGPSASDAATAATATASTGAAPAWANKPQASEQAIAALGSHLAVSCCTEQHIEHR